MNKKNKIILVIVVIVAIIAVIGGLLFTGVLSSSEVHKTPFDNKFISGDFIGTVNLINDSYEWALSYKDPVHHIEYNMTSCKNASFIIDLYTLQGMTGPDEKKFNGQEWDIYTGQGLSQVGNESTNKTLYVYMATTDKDNQSYILYIIFENNTNVDVDGSLYCGAFNDYVQPLLESITLKHDDNAPALYELLGVDEQTFNQDAELLKQVKKGNQTAIAQYQGAQV